MKVRVDKKALKAVKPRIRRLTARSWGVSIARRVAALNRFITGWCAYFAWAETPSVFAELDQGLRRRLRQCQWKQWKRVRTRLRELVRLGIKRNQAWQWANTRRGSWRVAGWALASCPVSCPTRTGKTWASSASPMPTVAFGLSGEPPDAWSACPVVWTGAG